MAYNSPGSRNAYLEPALLTDGTFAVNEAAVTDPNHAAHARVLAAATVATPLPAEYVTPYGYMQGEFPGGRGYFSCAKRPWSFDEPQPGMYRFEVRRNDFGYSGDPRNGNRRSEIVLFDTYGPAETLWTAWSTVLGPHDGMLIDNNDQFGLVHQWHGVGNSGKGPILGVNFSRDRIEIFTRSDADGTATKQVRYTTDLPATGVQTDFVIAGTLGETGHLDVWVNGTQVIDLDIPLGYYNDPGDLAYPHWGLYTHNQDTNDVIFHANIESGTTDLSARVSSPLPVTAPAEGWV